MTKPTLEDRSQAACVAEDISPLIEKGRWTRAEAVIAQAIADSIRAGKLEVLNTKVPLRLASGHLIHLTVAEILTQQQGLDEPATARCAVCVASGASGCSQCCGDGTGLQRERLDT